MDPSNSFRRRDDSVQKDSPHLLALIDKTVVGMERNRLRSQLRRLREVLGDQDLIHMRLS
jgi:hypothetical protein